MEIRLIENAIALCPLRLTFGADAWVGLGKAFLHQPSEGRLKLRPRPACRSIAARLPDGVEPCGYGLPRDLIEADLVQRAEILLAAQVQFRDGERALPVGAFADLRLLHLDIFVEGVAQGERRYPISLPLGLLFALRVLAERDLSEQFLGLLT